jgi:hypothetical protein
VQVAERARGGVRRFLAGVEYAEEFGAMSKLLAGISSKAVALAQPASDEVAKNVPLLPEQPDGFAAISTPSGKLAVDTFTLAPPKPAL